MNSNTLSIGLHLTLAFSSQERGGSLSRKGEGPGGGCEKGTKAVGIVRPLRIVKSNSLQERSRNRQLWQKQ
jgi:hypothetical protein